MANDGKRKNPWGGNNDSNQPPKSPWGHGNGGGQGGGNGQEPPDLDELIRRAQKNFNNVIPGGTGSGKIIGLAVLAVLGIWAISGFYVVNPGEQAVIQRFGEWSRTQTESGLGYHLPAPIETATIVNVEEIRVLNIGFSDTGTNRNSQRRNIPEESLMLTSDRNIVDLDLVVQWNIKSAEDYLFQIRDPENTVKKVAESAIREVVGQTSMFPIITTGRAELASRAREIIQSNLDTYNSGIAIRQVLIQKAEVHPEVQDAFQDVQSAKQDAEDVQNRAQAYREDIIPRARGQAIQHVQEAEGYKQSIVARAQGDAQRFDSIHEAYLSGKNVTKERIYIETMEEVLRNSQKIILDGKAGQGVVPYLPLNELQTPRANTASGN